MLTLRFVVCDVFTDRPLTGNQLAVFTDGTRLDADLMQSLAREMNFSESVFVLPPEQGGDARLRIFTPKLEIPFAGHPTLGSAFVLGGPLQRETLRLETGAGIVAVRLEREGARIVFGWMEQPLPSIEPYPESEELCAALGIREHVLPITLYDNGLKHVMVAVSSRDTVAALKPQLARLETLPGEGFNVFAGSDRRWKTRMFAPGGGVAEDPATGSAAGPLCLHLARHGLVDFGDEIQIEQGAELGRPSKLHARVFGSKEKPERVEVGGSAVIVARGDFRL
jgi:trans-2,3-dihydro-3-hydroxyanthranilate isomerase